MTGFTLDGRAVQAAAGETIWQVAQREGIAIPHLCLRPQPGYRPDGNCRACMVEIEGERVLAPSCQRMPREGMVVHSASERAVSARRMVMELLLADQPARAASPDPQSAAVALGGCDGPDGLALPGRAPLGGRYQPQGHGGQPRCLHPVRPVRARLPRGAGERRDRHGLSRRSRAPGVRLRRPGWARAPASACGECVQACPTGALMPASLVQNGVRSAYADRQRGQPVPVLRRRLPDHLPRQGRPHPACGRPRRAGQPQPAVREGALRLRLHHPSAPPHRAADPPRRTRRNRPATASIPANPWTHFRPASWEEALDRAAAGFARIRAAHGPSAPRRVRQRERIERGGLSVPEAGAHRLRHQQRRSLHPALPCLLGGGADGRAALRRGHRAVRGGARCRRDLRHRRQPDRQPPGRRDLHQERGAARRQADRRRPARPGAAAGSPRSICGSGRAPMWRC